MHSGFMLNMKSKIRLALMIGCVFTVLVIIYRTLGDPATLQKPEAAKQWQRPSMIENVNDLMDFDKPKVHSAAASKKHIVYETEVLTNSPPKASPVVANTEAKSNRINGRDPSERSNSVYDKQQNDWKNSNVITLTSPLPHILVHLDLKGAPPLISYYEQIFPLFVKLGVTGLLIEYEDMFPYWGSLRDISAYNAYSQQDIEHLVKLSSKHGLEIMPLVQTFGHMEFVLKHSTFAHLREISNYPQVICPSQNDTLTLITTMIDQVVALHPKIKWLHIGADEVYYLGQCNYCQQKMSTLNWERDQLFLEHVKSVAMYVKSKYGIQPIMWDDMFRQIPEDEIRSSNIWKHVQVMAWRYGREVLTELPPEVWTKYGNLFAENIWIASAFKGATGPSQFIPYITHHLENHNAWLDIIKTYNTNLQFRGITLTGWQRYDHFAVLCELLPASLPSLTVNLLFLQMGNLDPTLLSKATRILDCTMPLNLEFDVSTITHCNYPGGRVFEGVQQLYNIIQEITNMEASSHISGWLNQYNIDTRFSNPALVETANQKVLELKRNLTVLRDDMEHALGLIYDHHTVAEWLQLNLQPLDRKANIWVAGVQELISQNVWPRRPLSYNRTTSVNPHVRDTL